MAMGCGESTPPAPVLAAPPVVRLTPSMPLDGVPVARRGATLTVTLDVATPAGLEPAQTQVSYGGARLSPDPGGRVWTRVLDGSEPDGVHALDLVLVDGDGQQTTVRSPPGAPLAPVGFDHTPPTATCRITPSPARAGDAPALTISPDEPLSQAPEVSGDEVVVGPVTPAGDQWFTILNLPEDQDLERVVEITLTDRVGNTATGTSVCPTADRTVTMHGRGPTLQGAILMDGAKESGPGTVITVVIPTDDRIDPRLSVVTYAGLPLSSDDGVVWSATRDGTEDPEDRSLRARLVDVHGNALHVHDPGLDREPVATRPAKRTPAPPPAPMRVRAAVSSGSGPATPAGKVGVWPPRPTTPPASAAHASEGALAPLVERNLGRIWYCAETARRRGQLAEGGTVTLGWRIEDEAIVEVAIESTSEGFSPPEEMVACMTGQVVRWDVSGQPDGEVRTAFTIEADNPDGDDDQAEGPNVRLGAYPSLPKVFPPVNEAAYQDHAFAAAALRDRGAFQQLADHLASHPGKARAMLSPSTVAAIVQASMAFASPPYPKEGAVAVVESYLTSLPPDLSCREARTWLRWTYGRIARAPDGDGKGFYANYCRKCSVAYPELDLGGEACMATPGYRWVNGRCVHQLNELYPAVCP